MKKVKFKELWEHYPGEDPCSQEFSNQCAIRVGAALARCGVNTSRLVSTKRHCWFHDSRDGHVLAAEELAQGLQRERVYGINQAKEITGEAFRSKISGQRGINFLKTIGRGLLIVQVRQPVTILTYGMAPGLPIGRLI